MNKTILIQVPLSAFSEASKSDRPTFRVPGNSGYVLGFSSFWEFSGAEQVQIGRQFRAKITRNKVTHRVDSGELDRWLELEMNC